MHDVWPPTAVGVWQPSHRWVMEVRIEQDLGRSPSPAVGLPSDDAMGCDLCGHRFELSVSYDQVKHVNTIGD